MTGTLPARVLVWPAMTDEAWKPVAPAFKRPSAVQSHRRARVHESYQTAAECIGPIHHGMSVFAITRGQFSQIDAILHVLSQTGPAAISVWSWSIAEFDLDALKTPATFRAGETRVTAARLIIDEAARSKCAHLLNAWRDHFGPDSVRYAATHAKIALIEGGGFRVCIRGSLNLNSNPRFEQIDITEGGPEFDLIRGIEDEIPVLPPEATNGEIDRASKIGATPQLDRLPMFEGVKTWQP